MADGLTRRARLAAAIGLLAAGALGVLVPFHADEARDPAFRALLEHHGRPVYHRGGVRAFALADPAAPR